jgi:hypothetical protein
MAYDVRLNAMLSQYVVSYAGFVVGHHSPAFSTHGLHIAKPSGIEITAIPHL